MAAATPHLCWKHFLHLMREALARTLGNRPPILFTNPRVTLISPYAPRCGITCPHRHQICRTSTLPMLDGKQRLRVHSTHSRSLCASIRSFLRLRRFGPSICRGFATSTSWPQLANQSRAQASASPLPSPLAPQPRAGRIPQSLVVLSVVLPLSLLPVQAQNGRSYSACPPRSTPTVSRSRLGTVYPEAAPFPSLFLAGCSSSFSLSLPPVLPSLPGIPLNRTPLPCPACGLDHRLSQYFSFSKVDLLEDGLLASR